MSSTFMRIIALTCVLFGLASAAAVAEDGTPESPPALVPGAPTEDVIPDAGPTAEPKEASAEGEEAIMPIALPAPASDAEVPQAFARAERGVRVVVRQLGVDGSLAMLPGVEVRRERYKRLASMEGGTELTTAVTGRTGADGAVVFPVLTPVGVGESDRYVATWAGLEWEVEQAEGMPELSATVFSLTTIPAHFRMGLQVFVEMRDTNFLVQQQYTLINDSLAAIDFSGGSGLRIPLLIHEVFGAPLDTGYLPTRTDNQRTRFEIRPKEGRLSVERGTLIFRGIVPPGRRVQVLASFAVPYVEEDAHVLSLAAPFDLDDVRVAVVSPERSGLKAALASPHRTAPRAVPGGEEVWLLPLESPKAGQPLRLLLDHTPDRRAVTRNIATVLGGVVIFVISAIFFATRRRRKTA